MVVSTPMILGGAAVLAGGAYLLSKKSSGNVTPMTTEQLAASVAANNAKVVTGASEDAAENVVMDAATEEYNMARERYRMVAGSYPPRSWSVQMIDAWIEEQSKKEELLKEYVVLVSTNSSYVERENTDELTYQQLQALIDKTNSTINAKKSDEAKRRKALEDKCDKFITNATAYPGIGAATLSKYKWDTALLEDIAALPASDKRLLNEIFLEKTGGQGIKCCSYQAEAKSLWKYHKTIPEICGLTINSGKTAASRNGAWACRKVVEAYTADKVGADGSRVSVKAAKRRAVNQSVIAFHLRES